MLDNHTRSVNLGKGTRPCQTDLGRFIRTRRIELGLSQERLAELARVQPYMIHRYEVGITKGIRQAVLGRLALALQCDSADLTKVNPLLKPEPKSEFGKFVKARMEHLGLSNQDIQKRLGWADQFSIAKLSSISGFGSLGRWARTLECRPSELEPYLVRRGFVPRPGAILAKFVRTRRRELGLSLENVATALGVTRQAVSYIETGATTLRKKPDSIPRLAEILQVGVNELTSRQS